MLKSASLVWLLFTVYQVSRAGNSATDYQELEQGLRELAADDAYVNEWATYIAGGADEATAVARDLGYDNLGQIGSLEGYYLMSKPAYPRRSKRHAAHYTETLLADDRVTWAEQQYHKLRVKRDMIPSSGENRPGSFSGNDKKDDVTLFNDENWPNQWYLYDSASTTTKSNMGVLPVWAKNITGYGVVVAVIDDGLEYNHTDLNDNYDPRASYDFNDKDSNPSPRYDRFNSNTHGTRCAGEIAMIANNGICGVGVAYNANIGGIRMLDGTVTDSLEAHALTYNMNHIDIYSCSWGPRDDGSTFDKPGKLASSALEKGIQQGRQGKGVIYAWSAGNGGPYDNCGCDGYASSIFTISITSASMQDMAPPYTEQCPSTMATTYSSGKYPDQTITSTDIFNGCTTKHGGTSAAAPLAAGIFALALQANPDLTWRDLQHLVAWTSDHVPLLNNTGWKQNGAGFFVNERFGFGLLNADALVTAANKSTFKSVPQQFVCQVEPDESSLPSKMRSSSEVVITITTNGCQDEINEVNNLEHVQLTLNMTYSKRGNLRIYLTSPAGTETTLLTERPGDKSTDGFKSWPFMSVHNWGENPRGIWTIRFADNSTDNQSGMIEGVTLSLHGTRVTPDYVIQYGGTRN